MEKKKMLMGGESHLEGQQQSRPFFTPKIRQDGGGYDGEGQAHQDPNLTATQNTLISQVGQQTESEIEANDASRSVKRAADESNCCRTAEAELAAT